MNLQDASLIAGKLHVGWIELGLGSMSKYILIICQDIFITDLCW